MKIEHALQRLDTGVWMDDQVWEQKPSAFGGSNAEVRAKDAYASMVREWPDLPWRLVRREIKETVVETHEDLHPPKRFGSR